MYSNLFPMGRLKLADLEIDRAGGRVYRAGQLLPVRDRSFALLDALLDEAPAIVSHRDLLARVWGETVVCRETLAQRVRLLRRELGGDSAYIRSVRGRGYGLMAGPIALRRRRRLLTLAAAAALCAVASFLALQNASSVGTYAHGADRHAAKHSHD